MFSSLYVAAMRHLRPSEPGWAAKGWLGEVHLHNGIVTRPWISSLSAFWPGLQATIGALPFNYMQYQEPGIPLARWRTKWMKQSCPTYVTVDRVGQPRAGLASFICTSFAQWHRHRALDLSAFWPANRRRILRCLSRTETFRLLSISKIAHEKVSDYRVDCGPVSPSRWAAKGKVYLHNGIVTCHGSPWSLPSCLDCRPIWVSYQQKRKIQGPNCLMNRRKTGALWNLDSATWLLQTSEYTAVLHAQVKCGMLQHCMGTGQRHGRSLGGCLSCLMPAVARGTHCRQ